MQQKFTSPNNLPLSDEERVAAFLDTVRTMRRNRFHRSLLGSRDEVRSLIGQMAVVFGDGVFTSAWGYDLEGVQSLMHTFRRLTLQKDIVYLAKIYDSSARLYSATASWPRIQNWWNRVERFRKQHPAIGMCEQGTSIPITYEDGFKRWIYGDPEMCHRNEGDKHVLAWDAAPHPVYGRLMRSTGLEYVWRISREAVYLSKVLERAQRTSQTISPTTLKVVGEMESGI